MTRDHWEKEPAGALRSPVQRARPAPLVAARGGELTGERVARPEPASCEDESKLLASGETTSTTGRAHVHRFDLPGAMGCCVANVGIGWNGRDLASSRARSEAACQPVATRSRPKPYDPSNAT